MDDTKYILEKVSDDGDDIFEKVSDDAKDILEKVSDHGDDIFEKVSGDAKDILAYVTSVAIYQRFMQYHES